MKPARFTLIELLMVICIILILASLMLSALGKANRKAKFAICFNNSKQMALGTMIYTQINRGALPPASNTFWGKKGISWDDYISPLMGINLTQEQQEANVYWFSRNSPLCGLSFIENSWPPPCSGSRGVGRPLDHRPSSQARTTYGQVSAHWESLLPTACPQAALRLSPEDLRRGLWTNH